MKIKEIVEGNEPSIFRPQVAIPLDDYNLVRPILQRQQQASLPKPQHLTHSQLNQQLVAAHREKLRRLAIALQNRKIWAQSELVTPQDERDALKIGSSKIPDVSLDHWLDGHGNLRLGQS